MTELQKKFIGMVGLGYWGQNILRNLYELQVLHTACDPDTRIIAERQSKFPSVNYTTSFDDLLKSEEIQAVAIAAPAVVHYKLVKQALAAGKDVFVEKPLALTAKNGRELVELAESHNRILMVGHILQYHPAVLKLKDLVFAGELGKLQYICSNRLNIGKLRTEENILWSFAPHDISVILMLLQEEPISVSAFGGDYINDGVSDTTLTFLEFKNRVKAHIFVSWIHPYKEQKLIVVGSKAMAVFDDVSKEKLFLYPHKIEWQLGKIPIAQKAEYQVVPIGNGEPLREELRHFIDCVLNRKTPVTDGREGLRVLKILESAENAISSHVVTAGEYASKSAPGPKLAPQPYFVHESSYVDDEVEIGEGTKIWHFGHILSGTRIGKNCNIGQNAMVGPDVTIGNNCKIQNNVSIYKGVALEDGVFCGPSMVFTNIYNPRAEIRKMDQVRPTLVKRGATLGANSTVVCGNTIGRYAFVGAGTVVVDDVPDHAVVVGNPARQIGWACTCGERLPENRVCDKCGKAFAISESGLKEKAK
jgi:UDP-2-acetamido-3-amino-2,3-dideoxy-glucuronate N-acetyltransferase